MLSQGARVGLFAAAAVWLVALPWLVERLLRRANLVKPNFKGQPIPVGFGLVVVLWAGPLLAGLAARLPSLRREAAAYAACVIGMGALGLADDLFGDRTATGLRGHFRRFFRDGVITTGFVKAVGGGALALAVTRGVLRLAWPDALLDALLIALCTNSLNLLDLRPGRACATFLAASTLVIALQAWAAGALSPPLLLFVLIPALVVYVPDARAQAMLGDAGSNPLGCALGLAIAQATPSSTGRVVEIAVLAALHLVAERYSLSRIIERNPLLRRLDSLTGRR